MPATTMSANTRSTRSRYSSPSQAATRATAADGLVDPPVSRPSGLGSATQGQKSFMQRWLEPPVSNKASFQDAGLMRHGVVENMAPLGTLPKASMFKKATGGGAGGGGERVPEHTPIRRIIVKRPTTTQNTPAATTAASPVARQQSEEEAGKSTPAPTGRSASSSKDADDDWEPQAAASGPKLARKSISRTSTGRRGSLPSSQQPQKQEPRTPDRERKATPKMTPARMPENKAAVDAVVEAAVDQALAYYRYPTAWALRTLYDDNEANPEIISLFESVFNQTADAEALKTFYTLIREKKREGKRDNKGCYYFVPPSTNSRFTPHKPQAAPFADLITLDLDPSNFSVDGDHRHIKKKHKTHHNQHPRDSAKKMAAHRHTKGAGGTPTPKKNRSGSISSMSSLSSLSSVLSLSPSPGREEEEDRRPGIDSDEGEDGLGAGMGGGPSSSRPSTGPAGSIATTTAASTQPMGPRRRTMTATKKNQRESSPTPTPNSHFNDTSSSAHHNNDVTATSNTRNNGKSATQQAGMPAAVENPLFPNLAVSNKQQSAKDKQSGLLGISLASKLGKLDENDKLIRLKKRARNVTEAVSIGSVPTSFIRDPSSVVNDTDHESEVDDPARPAAVRLRISRSSVAVTPTGPAASLNTRSTRSSRKRSRDPDDLVSPTTLSVPPELAPPSTLNSRAGTPNPRAAKKPRTGLRVKNS